MSAEAGPVVSALIAAGGRGLRLGAGLPKQFLDLGGRTILERSIEVFARHPGIAEVVVALPPDDVAPMMARARELGWSHVRCVEGGARRQDSVANAFRHVRPDATIVAIHDAARPFVSAGLVDRAIEGAIAHGAAVPALPVRDTVKRAGGAREQSSRPIAATLPREDIFLAQTPQVFRRDVLARALARGRERGADATDEAMLAEEAGLAVHVIAGEAGNMKITTAEDLEEARARFEPGRPAARQPGACRVGTGYDLHRLVHGRPLVLAGVTIPFDKGLEGHSDADIVCHAVTDAILGAAAAGDIGRLFPDTDPRWKDADSLGLLGAAVSRLHAAGYRVGNVDVTVIAQRPKLVPYLQDMRVNLAEALQIDSDDVSVKGKTNETMDSMGRGESMACHAVATVVPVNHQLPAGHPQPS